MSTAVFAERLGHDGKAARAKFTAALVAAGAIVVLSMGRSVFVPLSLAAILAFALAPVTNGLHRLGLGRTASVIVTVLLASMIIAALALFLGAQFADLAGSGLPHVKLPLLQAINEPMPVWIAANLAEPLLNPLTSAGVAMLFAAFLLLQKDSLAERFARFARARDTVQGTGEIVEAGRAFGRHLLSQGLLDLSFGAAIAFGLWCIGVPNFGLWALIGVMLRSVPFVGVPVAALCPLMLAASSGPAALLVCETLFLFLSVNGALHLVERKWLNRSTVRLSAAAAIGATVVWTCLWGITGLLLAIPLTLGAVMLGRPFAPLAFLNRLLAGKSEEKPDAPPLFFAGRDPAGLRSDTAMRALAAAQRELDGSSEARLRCKRALGGTVSRLAPSLLPPGNHAPALRPWNRSWQNDPVLCIAGPGLMDEAAAGLLAEALKRKGLKSLTIAFEDVLPANLPRADLSGVRVVCVSCLDAADAPQLRQLVRRLRPRLRNASLVAGLWGWDGAALMDVGSVECDLVTTRLHEAAERIARLARETCEVQSEAGSPDFAPVAAVA